MTFVDDLRNRVLFTSVHGVDELLIRGCYEMVSRRLVGCKILDKYNWLEDSRKRRKEIVTQEGGL